MTDRFSMDGSVAIVTGGTRGIGLAIARGFLEAGASVTICGRKQEGVDAALRELGEDATRALGVAAHVGKQEDIDRLIAETESRFGLVNVLVNNAGTNPYHGPIIESEDRAWDKTMEVNLRAPYVLSRTLAKKLVARGGGGGGGSIVNISSIGGLQASANQGIYSVTKAGLIMLTKVMARELGAHGVRVNCICPGVIKTRLSQVMWSDPVREQQYAQMKALGRLGEPDEVVGAAIYLASNASSFTTGAVLVVDGGMVM